jgi:hypothetical protein
MNTERQRSQKKEKEERKTEGGRELTGHSIYRPGALRPMLGNIILKNPLELHMVTHTSNPSYMGGRGKVMVQGQPR